MHHPHVPPYVPRSSTTIPSIQGPPPPPELAATTNGSAADSQQDNTTTPTITTTTPQIPSHRPAVLFNSSSRKTNFHALYTRHKTQKRKVWQDGKLELTSSQAILLPVDAIPGAGTKILDTFAEFLPGQVQAIRNGGLTRIETETYLIQIEGPWTSQSNSSSSNNNNTPWIVFCIDDY